LILRLLQKKYQSNEENPEEKKRPHTIILIRLPAIVDDSVVQAWPASHPQWAHAGQDGANDVLWLLEVLHNLGDQLHLVFKGLVNDLLEPNIASLVLRSLQCLGGFHSSGDGTAPMRKLNLVVGMALGMRRGS
jgi:hypothetical protein